MRIFLIIVFNILQCTANAQKYPWFDSILTIPFVEDTVEYPGNKFVQFQKLGPTKSSKSDFELRIYFGSDLRWPMPIMLQALFNENKFERYLYYVSKDTLKFNFLPKVELTETRNDVILYRVDLNKSNPVNDSFFIKAFYSGLFNLFDQKKLVESLKAQNIVIYDWLNNNSDIMKIDSPSGYRYIEIKLRDKYRSFRVSNQADAYYYFNKNLSVFKEYYELDKFLNKYLSIK